MTKFFFGGVLFVLSILIIACCTMAAVLKVDSICNVSCVEKQLDDFLPFLQVRKLGMHKQIVSPEQQLFSCRVGESHMELRLTNFSCKEFLSRLSGKMQSREVERTIFFEGSGGVLNYQDASLNIMDCRFQICPSNVKDTSEEIAKGAMKSLLLSLKP